MCPLTLPLDLPYGPFSIQGLAQLAFDSRDRTPQLEARRSLPVFQMFPLASLSIPILSDYSSADDDTTLEDSRHTPAIRYQIIARVLSASASALCPLRTTPWISHSFLIL